MVGWFEAVASKLMASMVMKTQHTSTHAHSSSQHLVQFGESTSRKKIKNTFVSVESSFHSKVCLLDLFQKLSANTPPKTNMEPKNDGVEDEFPFQRDDFQVPC